MINENLDHLRDSASETVDSAKRGAGSALKRGQREASGLVDESGDFIEAVRSRGGEVAAEFGNGLIAFTKRNPLTMLLLGVGAVAVIVGVARAGQGRQ